MSHLKTKLTVLVMMLAFLFLWYNSSKIADEISTQNVSLRYEKSDQASPNGLSPKELEEIAEEDAVLPKIMLWNQTDNIFAETELDTSAKASLMDIYGANLLNMKMLGGSPLSSNDKSGCAVDEKTAYSLFGTVDAVGRTIFIGDEPYVIRGIFKLKEQLIMRNFQGEKVSLENVKFANAELLFENTTNGREDAGKFLTTYNLPRPGIIIDGSLLSMLLGLATVLPAIILTIILILRMLLRAFKVGNQLMLCSVAAISAIAAGVGLVFILKLPIEIPLRFIPSRWSDFSFWTKQLETISTHAQEALAFSKTVIEGQTIEGIATASAGLIAMLFLLILLLERIKVETSKQLSLFSFAAIISVFLFCVNAESGLPNNMRGIFLGLPCYFSLDFLIYKWDEWLKKVDQKEDANDFKEANSKYKQRFLSYEETEDKNKELA